MSKSTALTLYEASLQTPIFHMEDIYLTGNDDSLNVTQRSYKGPTNVPHSLKTLLFAGILAQVSGIRPQDNVGFSYVKRRATPCLYAQTISSHHLTIREMKDMHVKVKAKEGKCAPIKKKFLRSYGPGRCLWNPPK